MRTQCVPGSFLESLGTRLQGVPDLPAFCLVDMYMSCTEEVVKEEIIKSFTHITKLRIVAATVSFGSYGVHCFEVREVVHLGPPDDAESYIQETDCVGRDGAPVLALLLLKPDASKHVEQRSWNMQQTHLNVGEIIFLSILIGILI